MDYDNESLKLQPLFDIWNIGFFTLSAEYLIFFHLIRIFSDFVQIHTFSKLFSEEADIDTVLLIIYRPQFFWIIPSLPKN